MFVAPWAVNLRHALQRRGGPPTLSTVMLVFATAAAPSRPHTWRLDASVRRTRIVTNPDRFLEETMSVIVEIRAAEGGDDAKSLVDEQFALYARRALRDGL